LAAASIVGGYGDVCLSVVSAQAAPKKPGRTTLLERNPVTGGAYGGTSTAQPEDAFWQPAGISTRGASMAMIASRYFHEHGVTRESPPRSTAVRPRTPPSGSSRSRPSHVRPPQRRP
jgi:acetyl-CoA acetyltransferase